MEYHDLDIVLFPSGGKAFVRLARCGTRHGEGQETVPVDLDELAQAARSLDEPAGGGVDQAAQRALGLKLYEGMLGNGDVGMQLERCLDGAQTQESAGVRVRLNLDQAPSLAAIPWELVYLPGDERFLASSTRTPLVRYLESKAPNLGLEVRLPVRVLVVLPENAARGDAPLDLAREKATLQRALQPLVRADAADVRFLERRVTRARLRSALQGGLAELGEEPFQIVCYAGHGHHDESRACLFLDADGGGTDEVDQEWLSELFEARDEVKLVVLNACQGATVSALRPFGGLAPRLVKAGVPAVVAMQYPVRDDEALTFAEVFYRALFRGASRGRVEVALGEARKALRQDFPDSRGWGAPVLYMRSSGYLFTPTTGNALTELPVSREEAETQREAVREHERNIESLQSAPATPETEGRLERERREMGNARGRLRLRAAVAAAVLGVAASVTALAATLPFEELLSPAMRIEAYAAWLEGVLPGDRLDARIVRVPITARTEAARGRGFEPATIGAWRTDHARVLDALSVGGARVVAFAMNFPGPTDGDTAVARAIRDARRRGTRVVVGFREWDGSLPRIAPLVREAGPAWGAMCVGLDEREATVRILPLIAFGGGDNPASTAVPAFATAVVTEYHQDRVAGVDTEHRRVLFADGPRTRTMRFWQMETLDSATACPVLGTRSAVARAIITFAPRRAFDRPAHNLRYEELLGPGGARAAERARGKIVVIGRENPADRLPILRLGRQELRYGEQVQTDAVNSVLRGITLRPLDGWEQFLAAVASGAAGAAAALHHARRGRRRALLLAGGAALSVGASVLAVLWLGVLPNAWAQLAALLVCFALVWLIRRRFAL
jgi:CHASE2 domain-containing sensor protein